ncbi:hypothetical protein Tsubulata_037906 [Turnera subulata]|uniref:Uncharacterized protein n=1 Tax=Turnera subulata TaxID=218843 RepID=A0A9Q0G5L2_9ROSI|nr:hypothetical protein Tsubulata_037906 [Turnera subulata]
MNERGSSSHLFFHFSTTQASQPEAALDSDFDCICRKLNLDDFLEIFWMISLDTLICEVRDYRKCGSDRGSSHSSMVGLPTVQRVRLRIIPDIESPATTTLSGSLPKLDRLCDNPVPTRLNLDLSSL